MKKLLSCFLVFSFLLTGCLSIAKLKYGITTPKRETFESLSKFLKKNHYQIGNYFVFKDSASYLAMLKNPVFKRNLLTSMIVDKDFHKITIDTLHCQWSGGYFINRLKTDTTYLVESTWNVNELFPMLVSFPDSSVKIPARGDFDFLVINTWGKFIGKMNERLFATIPTAENRKDLRILVINLNIDIQKSWNLSPERVFKSR